MKTDVYNVNGEKVGQMELPNGLFGARWNGALVKQVYTGEQANVRRPWAHAKNRGDVRGGGRKPWRQKGTGRARHGSTRSPIWVGGGVAHGPLKERDYSVKLNKKMKRGALAAVLSRKLHEAEVVVLDAFLLSRPKTKEMSAIFKNLRNNGKIARLAEGGGKVLLALKKNSDIIRSSRNLPHVSYIEPRNINTSALLHAKYTVFDKNAIQELQTAFLKDHAV